LPRWSSISTTGTDGRFFNRGSGVDLRRARGAHDRLPRPRRSSPRANFLGRRRLRGDGRSRRGPPKDILEGPTLISRDARRQPHRPRPQRELDERRDPAETRSLHRQRDGGPASSSARSLRASATLTSGDRGHQRRDRRRASGSSPAAPSRGRPWDSTDDRPRGDPRGPGSSATRARSRAATLTMNVARIGPPQT